MPVFSNWKKIMLLAVPSIFSFATMTLTGTINLILVGRLGAVVIAIVGVTNIIMYNGWALFSGFGNTVNYLVAQSYGAGAYRQAVERTLIALLVCMFIVGFVCAAGVLGSGPLLKLITASDSMAETGEPYVQLRFFAMSLGIFSYVFHGFFRGIGDTRTPAVMTLIASGIMIYLTYALTYGKHGFPELGLTGAGWAFLIGETAGLAGCLFMFVLRIRHSLQTRIRIAFDRAESRLILLESGKLGIQEFAMSISMFLFTMFVGRLGAEALAANEIALNVMSLGFMPAFAFGATATILVGQEVGRGQPLKGKRYGIDVAVLGGIFLLVVGVLEFIFAEPIAKIYSREPQVYELVTRLIMVSAFLQLFDGMLNFFAGGLRGIGDTTFLMRTSFVCSFLVFVPMAYVFIFVFGWGSIGAWLSLYLFITLFGLLVTLRYFRTDWTNVKLKQAD